MGILVKARQQKDYTCGPAVLDAAVRMLTGADLSEHIAAMLACTNDQQGTTPLGLAMAAKTILPESRLVRGMTDVEFQALQPFHFMLLLISQGPNSGHWVMSCPNDRIDRDVVCLDDPWETGHYWSMTFDQLDDCWRWTFPYQEESRRCAVVLNPLVQRDIVKAYSDEENIRPWYLPKLANFPPFWKWSQRDIYKYEQTGEMQ